MQKYLSIFKTSLYFNYFYLSLIALLIFIPLYPKFPLINVGGTYVAIRLEDLIIGFVFVLWIPLVIMQRRVFFKDIVFQTFFLFFLIGFVSYISALFITFSVKPGLGLLHFLRRIEYMGLFLVAATTFKTTNQIKVALTTTLVTCFIVIVYGFGQIWLGLPVISTTNREFSKGLILYLTNGARVNSTFGGHYDLAVYLSICLSLLTGLFLSYKRIITRTLLAILGFLAFFLLGLTAARATFIATLFCIGLIFWLDNKKVLLIGLILASLLAVGLIPDLRHRLVATFTVNILNGGGPKYSPPPGKVTIFTDFSKYPKEEREKLKQQALRESTTSSMTISADTVPGEPTNSTELGVYRSWGIRLNVEWPRALRAFLKNPFLGTGYSSITLATDNDFLRSLGEVGILGTSALVLIFIIMFKSMVSYFRKNSGFNRYFTISMISATLALIISGVFIDVFEASKIAEIYWLLAGISWALTNIVDPIREEQYEN